MVNVDKKKKTFIIVIEPQGNIILRGYPKMEPGIYIAGLFLGAEPKYDKDGNRKGDTAGIAVGLQSYKVSVKSGVPANLAFSDPCKARVRPNIFNGNVYYSADELLLDDD